MIEMPMTNPILLFAIIFSIVLSLILVPIGTIMVVDFFKRRAQEKAELTKRAETLIPLLSFKAVEPSSSYDPHTYMVAYHDKYRIGHIKWYRGEINNPPSSAVVKYHEFRLKLAKRAVIQLDNGLFTLNTE